MDNFSLFWHSDPDRVATKQNLFAWLVHCFENDVFAIRLEPEKHYIRITLYQEKNSETTTFPRRFAIKRIEMIKILFSLDIREQKYPQFGTVRLSRYTQIKQLSCDCLPSIYGEQLRIYFSKASRNRLPFLSDLGFSLNSQEQLIKSVKPGMITLVVGSCFSGMTTTQYALAHSQNLLKQKAIAIGRPLDAPSRGISHISPNYELGLFHQHILEAVGRHDPDILIVELKDIRSMELSFEYARKGCSVIGAAFTASTAGGIRRIDDFGLPRSFIDNVSTVVWQNLVPRLCCDCKEETTLTKAEDIILSHVFTSLDFPLYKSPGCKKCCYVGYDGYELIYEILQPSELWKRSFKESATPESFPKLPSDSYVETALSSLQEKLQQGKISPKDACLRISYFADRWLS